MILGVWTQISSANPESLMAADIDGDSTDEIMADMGSTGLWLWNAGAVESVERRGCRRHGRRRCKRRPD